MLAGTTGALVTLGASFGFVLAGGVTVGIGTLQLKKLVKFVVS